MQYWFKTSGPAFDKCRQSFGKLGVAGQGVRVHDVVQSHLWRKRHEGPPAPVPLILQQSCHHPEYQVQTKCAHAL